MPDSPKASFVVIASEDESLRFINLSSVRVIESFPEQGRLRLMFDATHIIELSGPGAVEMFSFIAGQAVKTNGDTVKLDNNGS